MPHILPSHFPLADLPNTPVHRNPLVHPCTHTPGTRLLTGSQSSYWLESRRRLCCCSQVGPAPAPAPPVPAGFHAPRRACFLSHFLLGSEAGAATRTPVGGDARVVVAKIETQNGCVKHRNIGFWGGGGEIGDQRDLLQNTTQLLLD